MQDNYHQNKSVLTKFSTIQTFVFDMDGVLTDGSLIVMDPDPGTGRHNWYRKMHVRDGYALQLAVKMGYHVIIISGSSAPAVEDRMKRLGIRDVFFNVTAKREFLIDLFNKKSLSPATSLYMGDDIPDIPAMQLCSLPACPADAVNEIKNIALYISPCRGGDGCVRDVITKVMKLQGKWGLQPETAST